MDTSGGGIRGRVHNILIPETSIQDVKHEMIVLFGQVRPLEFQAMGLLSRRKYILYTTQYSNLTKLVERGVAVEAGCCC